MIATGDQQLRIEGNPVTGEVIEMRSMRTGAAPSDDPDANAINKDPNERVLYPSR